MVKQSSVLNCRAVGHGSNLNGGVGKETFYSLAVFLCFGWRFMPYIQSPKNAHLYHYRNNYRLEMINPLYSKKPLF